jgi:D-glycero-D-manno-heptose 1,7-bisphosphate phosphatase
MAVRSALFLDKDGTLLDDVPFNIDPAMMRLAPGASEALARFARHAIPIYVISNQSGVALKRFSIDALQAVEARLRALCGECGASLAGVYWCPHHPDGSVAPYAHVCGCRKPAPGLLLRAASEHGIDLASSCFIGDILDDVEAGRRAGCRTILLDNGNETEWREGPLRTPDALVANLDEASRVALRWLTTARVTPNANAGVTR